MGLIGPFGIEPGDARQIQDEDAMAMARRDKAKAMTPTKFSLSNEQPLTDTEADVAVKVVQAMVEKAISSRDGKLVLTITPEAVACEYQPSQVTQ